MGLAAVYAGIRDLRPDIFPRFTVGDREIHTVLRTLVDRSAATGDAYRYHRAYSRRRDSRRTQFGPYVLRGQMASSLDVAATAVCADDSRDRQCAGGYATAR